MQLKENAQRVKQETWVFPIEIQMTIAQSVTTDSPVSGSSKHVHMCLRVPKQT